MSGNSRHAPPPTRYGAVTVQQKAPGGIPQRSAVWTPPVSKFDVASAQAKPAKPPSACCPAHGAAPGILQRKALPQSVGGFVLQRMEEEFPKKPKAGQALDYYQNGLEYHLRYGSSDRVVDAWEAKTGTVLGMKLGTTESADYDESYIDIPMGARPSAPAALWTQVYAGLSASPYKGWLQVRCEELCRGYVYVEKSSKCEDNTNARPPMCHIFPYNHIKWAVEWLDHNRQHSLAQDYKGPGLLLFDNGTWRDLVWDASNLRPGHKACNSKTASAAKGAPSTEKEKKATLQYVVGKLKTMRPLWF